jgi:hypothetical protein
MAKFLMTLRETPEWRGSSNSPNAGSKPNHERFNVMCLSHISADVSVGMAIAQANPDKA